MANNAQQYPQISVRVADPDLMILKAAAEIRNETLSAYVRRVVTTAARETIDATIPDRDG